MYQKLVQVGFQLKVCQSTKLPLKAHKAGKVSFKYVKTFNMDEYVGISEDHPESYHKYLIKSNPTRQNLCQHEKLSWDLSEVSHYQTDPILYVSYHKHRIWRQIMNNHCCSLTAIWQVHVAELLQAHWHWPKGWIKNTLLIILISLSFSLPITYPKVPYFHPWPRLSFSSATYLKECTRPWWQCPSITCNFIFILVIYSIKDSKKLIKKNAHVLDGNAPDLAAECADYERKIAEVFFHLILFHLRTAFLFVLLMFFTQILFIPGRWDRTVHWRDWTGRTHRLQWARIFTCVEN